MKSFILLLLAVSTGLIQTLSAQITPQDSARHFKQLADTYRSMGLPEESIQMMIQAERETLFPQLAKPFQPPKSNKVVPKQAVEDDEELDPMMEEMIKKMGHDPSKVKQMMNETPENKYDEIPPLQSSLIAKINATPVAKADLLTYLKSMEPKVDAALDATLRSKTSPHLNKGTETKHAGYAYWLNSEPAPALYLMLKASIADPDDELLLSNFAACLTMTGQAYKAVPILEYLTKKHPESVIISNNLGQAWLSLGNISKAKPALEKAAQKETNHPEANRGLAKIALKEGKQDIAKERLVKSLTGAFSPELYNLLKSLDNNKNIDYLGMLRKYHKPLYTEVPIVKRFHMPPVPGTIEAAHAQVKSIEDFFDGLSITISDIYRKNEGKYDQRVDQYQAITEQMMKNTKSMSSLEDVQKQYELFGKISNPMQLKAQEILLNDINSDYATSYQKRFQQLDNKLSQQIKKLNDAFNADEQKLAKMRSDLSKMPAGEGESPAVRALELQICAFENQINMARIAETAKIYESYIQEKETLANLKLQEHLYWTVFWVLPQDPKQALYKCYADYLNTLYSTKSLYPLQPPAIAGKDCSLTFPPSHVGKGKMIVWEDAHCPVHWNINAGLIKTKFTCNGYSIGANVYGIDVGYGQKFNAVNGEIVEHSVYFGGSLGSMSKRIGSQLEVKAGAEAITTIKFGGDGTLKDIAVKVSAGVELGVHVPDNIDPNDSGLDLRQAASQGISAGSVEISIQSGFRGEGTIPEMISKMF
jgi:hypothetical protein